MQKSVVAIYHILALITATYLTIAIVSKQKIPTLAGWLVGLLTLTGIVVYAWEKGRAPVVARGIPVRYDPDDPNLKIIGGAGGMGWL